MPHIFCLDWNSTLEIETWISNCIPHRIIYMIIDLCPNPNKNMSLAYFCTCTYLKHDLDMIIIQMFCRCVVTIICCVQIREIIFRLITMISNSLVATDSIFLSCDNTFYITRDDLIVTSQAFQHHISFILYVYFRHWEIWKRNIMQFHRLRH